MIDAFFKRFGKTPSQFIDQKMAAQPPAKNPVEKDINLAHPPQAVKIKAQEKPLLKAEQIEDKDLALQLENLMHNSTMGMPKDSPFVDTDLIIFKDSYRGKLPLNGILQRDFKETCDLFYDLCKNKTAIDISSYRLDHINFSKEAVLELFKKLLTRDIGRRLVKKVAQNKNHPVKICLNHLPGRAADYKPKDAFNPENEVLLNLDEHHFLIETDDAGVNRVRKKECRPFISLAHELTHHLHNDSSKMKLNEKSILHKNVAQKPTFEKDYDNLEEQVTITGFSKEPHMIDFLSAKKRSALEALFEAGIPLDEDRLTDFNAEKILETYDEFNERHFEMAFADSEHKVHPRFGHQGINAYLASLRAHDLKSVRKEDMQSYLSNLDEYNVPIDLLELLISAKKQLPQATFNAICKSYEDKLKLAAKDSNHPWHQQLKRAGKIARLLK